MALIQCPECGRENVSDTAVSCPGCGYNIALHYSKHKNANEEKIEEDNPEETELNEIPLPKKPTGDKVGFCAILTVLSLVVCVGSLILSEEYQEFAMLFGYGIIAIIVSGAFTFSFFVEHKNLMEQYRNAHMNPEQYRLNILERQKNLGKRVHKCPYCGGQNFTPVRRKWTFMAGFWTNKVDLICNNCGRKVR